MKTNCSVIIWWESQPWRNDCFTKVKWRCKWCLKFCTVNRYIWYLIFSSFHKFLKVKLSLSNKENLGCSFPLFLHSYVSWIPRNERSILEHKANNKYQWFLFTVHVQFLYLPRNEYFSGRMSSTDAFRKPCNVWAVGIWYPLLFCEA